MNCLFCDRECKNLISLSAHSRLCKNNPNKQKHPNGMLGKKGSNQFLKAKEIGLQIIVSDTTKEKLSEAGKKQIWNDIRRKKHSDIMKNAVANNPESYTSSNRGRIKQIEKYGIKFQGKWELIYFEWCLTNSIQIERCVERFPYEWNGNRSYNPDFYLPESDTYVEVKGYETDRDRAKWKFFPKKLIIIRRQDIFNMRL